MKLLHAGLYPIPTDHEKLKLWNPPFSKDRYPVLPYKVSLLLRAIPKPLVRFCYSRGKLF